MTGPSHLCIILGGYASITIICPFCLNQQVMLQDFQIHMIAQAFWQEDKKFCLLNVFRYLLNKCTVAKKPDLPY